MTMSTADIGEIAPDRRTSHAGGAEHIANEELLGSRRASGTVLVVVRYVLPALLVLAAFVLVAVEPNKTGLEGWSMLMGSGLSVLLVNGLYRLGVSGEAERAAEEAARAFLDEHGYWPDEAPASDRS